MDIYMQGREVHERNDDDKADVQHPFFLVWKTLFDQYAI